MSEALVLLPDIMSDARLFAPVTAVMSRERSVTIAPVHQGERIEEIASGLLAALPTKFALAGLGLGGVVAIEVMRRAPDRVTRLCLMGASPLSETPQDSAAREPWIIGAKAGRLAEVMRDVLPAAAMAPGPGRMAVQNLAAAMAAELGPEVFVRQMRAMQRRRDQQGTLRRCKVPALVLCGEHDTLVPPKRHEFLAELIPYAELGVIPGAGHWPTLEQPDAVVAAFQGWLKQPFVLR